MSTGGATVTRSGATRSCRSPLLVNSLSAMVVSLSSSACLDRDLTRLALGHLGKPHGQEPVLDVGRRALGVHPAREREAAREPHGDALLPMHRVTLGRVRLALAAQGEDVLLDGHTNVLLAQTG